MVLLGDEPLDLCKPSFFWNNGSLYALLCFSLDCISFSVFWVVWKTLLFYTLLCSCAWKKYLQGLIAQTSLFDMKITMRFILYLLSILVWGRSFFFYFALFKLAEIDATSLFSFQYFLFLIDFVMYFDARIKERLYYNNEIVPYSNW